MKITLKMLKSYNACNWQLKLFKNCFGEEVEVTNENLIKAAETYLDIEWLLRTSKEFKKAVMEAQKCYVSLNESVSFSSGFYRVKSNLKPSREAPGVNGSMIRLGGLVFYFKADYPYLYTLGWAWLPEWLESVKLVEEKNLS